MIVKRACRPIQAFGIFARFQKLSLRSQLVIIAMLWAVLAVAMGTTHKTFANEYYRMERTRLQTIASTAAFSGARLLPSDPYAAKRAAHAYAEMNGIPACMRKLLVILNSMLHNKTHWHATVFPSSTSTLSPLLSAVSEHGCC